MCLQEAACEVGLVRKVILTNKAYGDPRTALVLCLTPATSPSLRHTTRWLANNLRARASRVPVLKRAYIMAFWMFLCPSQSLTKAASSPVSRMWVAEGNPCGRGETHTLLGMKWSLALWQASIGYVSGGRKQLVGARWQSSEDIGHLRGKGSGQHVGILHDVCYKFNFGFFRTLQVR